MMWPDRLRALTAEARSNAADAQLGLALSFVAGAINAGGFLAVGQYTSHMSGIISAMADNIALGAAVLAVAGLAALLAFLTGAALCAMLVNWARRRGGGAHYALPLLLEAALLLLFGAIGGQSANTAATAVTIPLLCFIMGLQNAIITKASGARIRTTHMTGVVTDIGIELGKLFYWNRRPDQAPIRADRAKLRLLSSLLAAFFTGDILGALGFSRLGFAAALPFAALLLLLGLPGLNALRPAPPRQG